MYVARATLFIFLTQPASSRAPPAAGMLTPSYAGYLMYVPVRSSSYGSFNQTRPGAARRRHVDP